MEDSLYNNGHHLRSISNEIIISKAHSPTRDHSAKEVTMQVVHYPVDSFNTVETKTMCGEFIPKAITKKYSSRLKRDPSKVTSVLSKVTCYECLKERAAYLDLLRDRVLARMKELNLAKK